MAPERIPTYQSSQYRNRNRRRRRRNRPFFFALLLLILVMIVIAIIVFTGGKDKDGDPSADDADQSDIGNQDEPETPPQPVAPPEPTREERIAAVFANSDNYPTALMKLLENNPEALEFVEGYQTNVGTVGDTSLTSAELSAKVPHLIQWDTRWGYAYYAGEPFAFSGCGPTCLSMVIVSLTGNKDASPYAVGVYSEDNDYVEDGDGTKWTLMSEGCSAFGVVSEELPLWKDTIDSAIEDGKVLVFCLGPGDFTTTGHFIVVYDIADNGEYMICDPNSMTHSSTTWSYERLEDQIQNIWAFEKAE